MQSATVKRRPGRPPTYVFDRPDEELTENERRLRSAVLKRRERQNRSYRRRKLAKSQQLAAAAALHAASVNTSTTQLPSRSLSLPSAPRTTNSPHLALFDGALSAPLPSPVSVSAPDTQSLRTPLYLPRLQSSYNSTRLPPTTTSISAPNPPHLPHRHPMPPPPPPVSTPASTTSTHYETTVTSYGFEVSPHHSASTPPAIQCGPLRDSATVTTGTLFSAPTRAETSESPLGDTNLALSFNGEPQGQPPTNAPVWASKYENCTGTLPSVNVERPHGHGGHVQI